MSRETSVITRILCERPSIDIILSCPESQNRSISPPALVLPSLLSLFSHLLSYTFVVFLLRAQTQQILNMGIEMAGWLISTPDRDAVKPSRLTDVIN
jgi:hypothetical protein